MTNAKVTTRAGAQGFICTTCSTWHMFGVYVAAHADMKLTHTCEQCGARHEVLRYKVRQLTAGKTPDGSQSV